MENRNRRFEGPNYGGRYERNFEGRGRSSGAWDSPDLGGYTGMGRSQGDQGSDREYGMSDMYDDMDYSRSRGMSSRSDRDYDDERRGLYTRGSRFDDIYDEYGDTDRGWRGYQSSAETRGGRGYDEENNPERRYHGSRGFSRGGYETGYGDRGMRSSTGSHWGDYGSGSYRGYNEYTPRENRGGYGTQDNEYNSWNLGNYGSRGTSEREHYGSGSRGERRGGGYRGY